MELVHSSYILASFNILFDCVLPRKMSEPFQKALIGTVLQARESSDLRLREEVSKIPSDTDGVVEMLARCLPYIVPNVLLAKREVRESYSL